MAASYVAENTISLQIGRRLYVLWRHSSVTWPDPSIFFCEKLRKGRPISYAKFLRDPLSGSESIPGKLMGGGGASTPCTGEG